jgi:membrane fusion protein (multidrug efflux system)
VSALNNKKFEGEILVKSVSANSISHTYPVNIVLSNPKMELLPGMVCMVELFPDNKSPGVVIPINLVQINADEHKFVWCEKGGVAKRIFVTTGAAKGNGVEITSGLSAGDRIITEGYQKISEDEKIIGQ